MGVATFVISTTEPQDVHANRRYVKGVLTLSSSYATGGDSFDLAVQTGLSEIQKILVDATTANDSGATLTLAGTSKVPLIKAWATKSAEVANATNASTWSFPVWLLGT